METAGLAALFASSFLSATLLPGNSEIVFLALVHQMPELEARALAVATVGNTLGGMTSYLIGRLFPKPRENRAVAWLARRAPAVVGAGDRRRAVRRVGVAAPEHRRGRVVHRRG